MKFKYVGPNEGKVVAYGTTFEAGKAVEIKDEYLAAKAGANPDFEVVKAAKKKKKKS